MTDSLDNVAARLETLTDAQSRRVWAMIVADMGTDSAWLSEQVRGLRGSNLKPAEWIMGTITVWERVVLARIPGVRARSVHFSSGWGGGVRHDKRDTSTARATLINKLSSFIDLAVSA